MMEAIIYARFSKADQVKGHSIERQLDHAREVCASRDWVASPALTFTEKGKSAFTGANRAKGSLLAKLEAEIAAGAHVGRTLVVEHLDRISRQGWQEVLDFLRTCSGHGVSVATWDGSRHYPAGQPVQMVEVIEIILKSELAHEESDKKSKRILKSFAAKREAAATAGERKIASRPPSWIERLPNGAGYRLIEERADIVRRAHRLAQIGYGTAQIAATFNQENIRTWRASSNGWHESYVGRMLTVRTAIGEYTSEAHGTRILDYYPPVITVEEYNRTQAVRAKRTHPANRGRRGVAQSNLFQGLARCSHCGGNMLFAPSRRAGRQVTRNYPSGTRSTTKLLTDASYLQCWNSKRRVTDDQGQRICTNNRSVRYEWLEAAVLGRMMSFALDNDRFNVIEISRTRIDLAETERRLSHEREGLETLKANLKIKVSATLVDMLGETEDQIAELEAKRAELSSGLTREKGSRPTLDFIARIQETRAAMSSPDLTTRRDARTMVHDSLREVISDLLCDDEANALVIVASGLAAFRVNSAGEITWQHDSSGDAKAIEALTTGAFEANRGSVDAVLARAKRARAA